jgi:hypothetical protein
LLKGTLICVEMKTSGDRYVFTSMTPTYNAGTQDDPETDPPYFKFAGSMQLPSTIEGDVIPKFFHLCGSLGAVPCESADALQTIIDSDSATDFAAVLLGTYEVDEGDEVTYQADQLISASITVPVTYVEPVE